MVLARPAPAFHSTGSMRPTSRRTKARLTNNISPAPETLQEVKLQTSLVRRLDGTVGGGNFQLITKSGAATSFTARSYWYVQNERFNANDFFFNKDGIDRPKARRNEGGFTIGGPMKREGLLLWLSANTGHHRIRSDRQQHHGPSPGPAADQRREYEGEPLLPLLLS